MSDSHAISAQAELHHQYFIGLQLMVAVEESRSTVYDWMFRLFRRQHEEKFLSSFDKLGLRGLPDAIACAQYHALSNSLGGVAVEYMEESASKAWVRFRYPRWMYSGAAICGIPVEASRGFLYGWYGRCLCPKRLADRTIVVTQTGLSIVRNLEGADRHTMLVVWVELWRGAIHSHRALIDVQCDIAAECLRWTLSDTAGVLPP